MSVMKVADAGSLMKVSS